MIFEYLKLCCYTFVTLTVLMLAVIIVSKILLFYT